MTWLRLEGCSVDADLVEAPEAQVADPFWLLGKQWQVGELTGDDAASPVLIEAEVAYAPVTRFQAGVAGTGSPVVARPDLGVPLETAVEREDVEHGPAAQRLSAEAGLELMRRLDDAGVPLRGELRSALPLRLADDDGVDPLGRDQLELLARRSCDGAALLAALDAGTLSRLPGLAALRRRPGSDVLAAWRSWYGGVFSLPPAGQQSWDAAAMEYRFRVGAHLDGDAEVVLDAPEYRGDRLDWFDFDLREDLAALGAPAARSVRSVTVAAVPARFAGQAASRFWQVEDGEVWFGDLHVGATDLARAAVAAYGLSYGDDWFQVPVRLPAGVLARVERVTVRDTYGNRRQIRSCAELDGPGRSWRYFELSGDSSADAADLKDRRSPWLFLAPVLAGSITSKPVEEVVFLRDQVANLGWGVEVAIESAAGRRVDRAALARARRPAVPTPHGAAWLYLLGTAVLDNQVPLVPVRGADGQLYLQRGRLATAVNGDDAVQTQSALGQILQPGAPLLVLDGEVPDSGITVIRRWQMARSAAGQPVCWMGRNVSSAPPRRGPGLAFDQVIDQ
jgi:hypothetical protein